ncbi:MAG: glycoside hydrolase family 3 N-terminal domain-containing protein, partial [Bacteroidota bacterium]
LGFQGRGESIQGDHIIATLKHMTGHGEPEGGNNIGPAHVSERTIREAFLPPFKKAVQEGRVRSVMASYNEIDGVPSHANKWLLQDILRGEWNFKGSIVSDYYAIRELHDRHKIVVDHETAAIKAMETGVDIELPDPEAYPLLKQAIENGKMKESVLDTAVARILRHKFEMGLFEEPYVDPERAKTEVGSEANAKLALKAAEESMILLQNEEQILPLDPKDYKTIAVIGPNADEVLLGGYSSHPKYFVSVLEGIKNKVGKQTKVVYAEGCKITQPGSWYEDPVMAVDEEVSRQLIAEAVKLAAKADVVILAIGGNEQTSREAWAETHLGDRTDLQMVGLQDELVDQITALDKPTVALLFNGRPLAVNNVKAKVPAIVECWYLGQETG